MEHYLHCQVKKKNCLKFAPNNASEVITIITGIRWLGGNSRNPAIQNVCQEVCCISLNIQSVPIIFAIVTIWYRRCFPR